MYSGIAWENKNNPSAPFHPPNSSSSSLLCARGERAGEDGPFVACVSSVCDGPLAGAPPSLFQNPVRTARRGSCHEIQKLLKKDSTWARARRPYGPPCSVRAYAVTVTVGECSLRTEPSERRFASWKKKETQDLIREQMRDVWLPGANPLVYYNTYHIYSDCSIRHPAGKPTIYLVLLQRMCSSICSEIHFLYCDLGHSLKSFKSSRLVPNCVDFVRFCTFVFEKE